MDGGWGIGASYAGPWVAFAVNEMCQAIRNCTFFVVGAGDTSLQSGGVGVL